MRALLFAKELLHEFLQLGRVGLGGGERLGDLGQAHLLIRLRGAFDGQLVTVLLDGLAAVPDLVEAQCRRGAFQEVAETGELVQLLFRPVASMLANEAVSRGSFHSYHTCPAA